MPGPELLPKRELSPSNLALGGLLGSYQGSRGLGFRGKGSLSMYVDKEWI